MKQDELSGSQSVSTTEQVKETELEGAPAVLGVPDPQAQSNPVPGRPKITQAKPLPKITEGQKKLAFWLHKRLGLELKKVEYEIRVRSSIVEKWKKRALAAEYPEE
jgi:hypothetical protein